MKRFARKITVMTLVAALLAGTVISGNVYAETVNSKDLHFVSGTMYNMDQDSTIPNGIQVFYASNLKELLSGDNTVYDKDIAQTAEILAMDVYDNVKVGGSEGKYTAEECKDNVSIYSDVFGMDNAQMIDLSQMGYTQDVNDITRLAIAHENIAEDGTEQEIIVVSVQGTDSTYEQWCSNYDIGSEDLYPGEHSEWLDHDNHKGFDVTYRRALALILQYISENVSASAQKTILITGHSRGGSIANLLGKYFEDDASYKSFTYTFAAPGVTTKTDTSAATIFNVINEDDVIPYFPLKSWGFTRYGTDKVCNMADSDMKTFWNSLTGIDYVTCTGSKIETLTAAVADSRSEIYIFDETDVCGESYKTEAQAEAKMEKYKQSLKNLGFSDDYYVFEITENPSSAAKPYQLKGYISPGFLMEFLAGLATASSSVTYMGSVGNIINIMKIPAYSGLISFMVVNYLNNSIYHAHCHYTYYAAAAAIDRQSLETAEITGTVTAAGNALAGQTLTADYDGNAGNYIAYQWIRVDQTGTETEIDGASARQYQLTEEDVDCTIKVKITGIGFYSGSLTSEATDKVAPETFTVTFDANGYGTAPKAQTIVKGSLAVKPDDLQTDEAVFCGWFKDKECSVVWDFTTEEVISNTTIYAKWKTATILKEKEKNNAAFGQLIGTAEEITKVVLTAEDRAAISAGSDVYVWAEVKDVSQSISNAEKKQINKKLPDGYTDGNTYLDIALYKQIRGEYAVKVTKTPNGVVKIRLTVPSELQKEGRSYKIIRVYDGKAEVIESVVGENNTITFESDRFSTYALIYKDAAKDTPAPTPETGDTNMIFVWALLMLLAAGSGIFAIMNKRREK